ncbi:response regulator [Leisingera daeponensis]|uniref:Response regulator n=1 Tax=Leisingera daeponensis TaxID=405746 RepID=A0ABS7N9J4_9RHOB|nr:response regulator [Leisingera daeponensis]MBY6054862.1 response regulator [Leisingera daeponensis]MBY6137870.1 response regulator [Leisingera daeponensis]
MNILLVEDNDVEALIMERILKKHSPSARVVRACDGLEALEILTSEQDQILPQPFFILLDINMPRMNGHEFLDELRARKEIASSFVFMFSTSGNPDDIARAYQRNVSGYIVKPSSSAATKEVLSALQDMWEICTPPQSAGR